MNFGNPASNNIPSFPTTMSDALLFLLKCLTQYKSWFWCPFCGHGLHDNFQSQHRVNTLDHQFKNSEKNSQNKISRKKSGSISYTPTLSQGVWGHKGARTRTQGERGARAQGIWVHKGCEGARGVRAQGCKGCRGTRVQGYEGSLN